MVKHGSSMYDRTCMLCRPNTTPMGRNAPSAIPSAILGFLGHSFVHHFVACLYIIQVMSLVCCMQGVARPTIFPAHPRSLPPLPAHTYMGCAFSCKALLAVECQPLVTAAAAACMAASSGDTAGIDRRFSVRSALSLHLSYGGTSGGKRNECGPLQLLLSPSTCPPPPLPRAHPLTCPRPPWAQLLLSRSGAGRRPSMTRQAILA